METDFAMRGVRVALHMLMLGLIGGRCVWSAAADSPGAPPNEALAALAKEIILESLPPRYEKRKNWGHQKEVFAGYQWVVRDGRWRLDERTEKVNDGLWRMYRVWLVNPQRNLQVRISQPRPTENGRTAFQVFLTARLRTDARQERWRLGVKGLNFHIEADATVEARLAVEVGVRPVVGAGFGTIEVQPQVTNVDLVLHDLSLKQVSKIGGDLAQELGNALRGVVEGELRDREPDVKKKINAAIRKNRDKLRFSPTQFAEIGWEKIQALLSASPTAD